MQLPNCSSKQQQDRHLLSIAVCQGSHSSSQAQEQDQNPQLQQQQTARHSRVGELAVQEVLTTVGLSKHATTLVRSRCCLAWAGWHFAAHAANLACRVC
jgi:hypothetical protein